ncbi:MAG: hypothetical protein AAGI53_01700 [Planctomycetota bacterium]
MTMTTPPAASSLLPMVTLVMSVAGPLAIALLLWGLKRQTEQNDRLGDERHRETRLAQQQTLTEVKGLRKDHHELELQLTARVSKVEGIVEGRRAGVEQDGK